MGSALDDLVKEIEAMPPDERAAMEADLDTSFPGLKYWTPQEGPQQQAYFSKADILLFGGRAGGGKSDLGLGLAFTEHMRTLCIRKQINHLGGLVDRAAEIKGTGTGLKRSSPPRLTISGEQLINFGYLKQDGSLDAVQGVPHDLIYYDEVAQLNYSLVRTTMAWNRPGPGTPPDQRCRIVFGSNPPLTDEGIWLFEMFAAWLDPRHPNPAKPGELRWYVMDEFGRDTPVDGPGVYEFDDEGYPVPSDLDPEHDDAYGAQSRTFIPSKLSDNKYLGADYKRVLDNLLPRERAALRDGKFDSAENDHEAQLIPSSWLRAAQDRWSPNLPVDRPMCNMGVDVARGGEDDAVIYPRYDGYFPMPIVIPGPKVPTGKALASEVLVHRRDKSDITIDMGGGYGGAVYETLKENIENVYEHKGAKSTPALTESGSMGFYNTRALVFYRLFEALDPDQPGGSHIMLPPDPKTFGELCSIRRDANWTDVRVIKLETKRDLVKRLGYSPGRADAISISWSKGPKLSSHRKVWKNYSPKGKGGVKRAPRRHSARKRR